MSDETTHCPYCEGEVSESAKKCRHCGEWIKERESFCGSCGTPLRGHWAAKGICAACEAHGVAMAEPPTARLTSKTESFGEGCAIQGIGCLGGLLMIGAIPVLGWIAGPIFILAMLSYGGQKAKKWFCANCGNEVSNKDVRLCGACGANLIR